MRENAGYSVDAAVDGDDRHAGVHRFLQRRRERIDLVRRDDDAVDALGDGGLDVGGLLRRRALAVGLHDLDVAELVGLGMDLLHHVDEERKGHVRHRRQDGQMLLLSLARRSNGERKAHCTGNAARSSKDAS